MKTPMKRALSIIAILTFAAFAAFVFTNSSEWTVLAQDSKEKASPEPTPTPEFDQKAAIAKIKEQIKGKEQLPAGEVFKNIKRFKQFPAGRLLAVMEFGYARSLGVDCTHCHVADDWASESKSQKQTAREMHEMVNKLNGEILPAVTAFKDRTGRGRAIVNCTTCHRGAVKPATNLGK